MISTQLSFHKANVGICARNSRKISFTIFYRRTSFTSFVKLLTIFCQRLQVYLCLIYMIYFYIIFTFIKSYNSIKTDTLVGLYGHFCKRFSLRVLLSFWLIFSQLESGVAYKSVAYKKLYITTRINIRFDLLWNT